MWTYESSTGLMLLPNGKKLGYGFAGQGEGLNNPKLQDVPNTGPLPENDYKMTQWIDKHDHLGMGVIILSPWDNIWYDKPVHNPLRVLPMFGRSGFAMHGYTNLLTYGLDRFLKSSEGCICIGDLAMRRMIWQHDDDILRVVAKIS